jgi:hypothetical protein
MTEEQIVKPSRVKALAEKLTQHEASDETAPSWVKYIALLTGILAGIAGFLTVRETMLTNEAIYQSNQAVLAQAQSSDAWAEYQSDSIKARIVETQIATGGTALDPQTRAQLQTQAQDFRTRQPKLQAAAQAKEAERDNHLAQGNGLLGTRDLISYADLAIQLAIALASVAAMVRVRRAFDAAIAVGGIGVVIALYALSRHYLAGGGL